jgi:ribosomal protein S28E/S33
MDIESIKKWRDDPERVIERAVIGLAEEQDIIDWLIHEVDSLHKELDSANQAYSRAKYGVF